MLPGPTYFYQCPNCDNLLRRDSLNSGNTFGSEYYSDGKRIAPMLPEFPNLTKCSKCNTIFWLSKLKPYVELQPRGDLFIESWFESYISYEEYCKHLGKLRKYRSDKFCGRLSKKSKTGLSDAEILEYDKILEMINRADNAEFLSIYEYALSLKKKIYTSIEDELFIRLRIWWGFNDRVRNGEDFLKDETDKILWKRNCYKLLKILNIKNVEQRLLIAELNRNLGNFDKCIKILDSMKNTEYEFVKITLIKACQNKNTKVLKIINF
jgi:hypothetical protein